MRNYNFGYSGGGKKFLNKKINMSLQKNGGIKSVYTTLYNIKPTKQ